MRNLLMSAVAAFACVSAAFAQKAAEEKAAPAAPAEAKGAAVILALPLVPAQKVEAKVVGKAVAQEKGKADPKAKVEMKKEAAKAAVPAIRIAPARAIQVEGLDVQFVNGQRVPRPNQPPDPLALALQALSRANPNAVDPQTSQLMLQYRSLLAAEYGFLVAICKPDKDRRRTIARAGEAALVRYCEAMSGQDRARLMRNGRFPQIRDYFQDVLFQAACANLPPRDVARYRGEIKARQDYRSEAVFRGTVALLDMRLYLTPEQREKVEAKLRADWKDPPEPEALQYYFNQPNSYLPNFAGNLIEPLLDDDQKLVFKSIQKVSFGHGFAMNERGDLPLEDAELPPYVVRMPEPRKPQKGIGLGGAIFQRVQRAVVGD